MNRNMDLCRLILKKIESCEDPWGPMETLEISGYSDNQVAYHVKILSEAGLLNAQDVSSCGPDGFDWIAGSLTWQGHDFLDAAKDDTIWDKAKTTVFKPTASFTFDLLLEWLKVQAKEKLGLP